NTDQDRNQQRKNGKLQRRGQPAEDEPQRRLVIDKAVTETAPQRVRNEVQILLPQRLVQAETGDEASPFFLGGFRGDQYLHGISDDVDRHEDRHRHGTDDEQRLQNSTQQ